MIANFLDSALVIDDLEKEAQPLVAELMKNDIFAMHYTPNQLFESNKPVKSRKIVFMDLRLQEGGADLATNIGIIRNLLQQYIANSPHSYGLVIWSKHQEELKSVIDRIEKDKASYTLPLFIIGLDKMKYIESGYDELFADMEASLGKNLASNFFMYWSRLVEKGKDQSITALYNLSNNGYSTLEKNLQFVLYKLAKNHTGIPNKPSTANYKLENDAVKALADILNYDLINDHDNAIELFRPPHDYQFTGDRAKLFDDLNARIFIDGSAPQNAAAIPGNVYEILEEENIFIVDGAPANSRKVVIELTPPCDFATGRNGTLYRLIGGFIIEAPAEKHLKDYNKEHHYKYIDSISIPGSANPVGVRFDFRYLGTIQERELLDAGKYRLLFRVKDKLFADILQKCGSHASRLGIPFIK